jgi:hypothetical protein
VSVTTTLPFGSTDDVKRDVERCFRLAAPGGGFGLASTSSILPETPDENILALYQYGKEFGGEFLSDMQSAALSFLNPESRALNPTPKEKRMSSRERVLLALNHKEADRVAIHDSPWGTTLTRWRKEGLPEKVSPADYFGYEFRANSCDNTLQLPIKKIEETPAYVIATTGDGAVRKNWKGATSTPELIDFTITTRAKWEEHKPRMVMNEKRVDWVNQLKANKTYTEMGFFRYMSFGPGFTKVCNMVGPERLLMAIVEDPDWVKDMVLTEAKVCVAAAEEMMARGFEFDAGWIFDDLGYKQHGFFSPATYREIFMPAHKLICDCFNEDAPPLLRVRNGIRPAPDRMRLRLPPAPRG